MGSSSLQLVHPSTSGGLRRVPYSSHRPLSSVPAALAPPLGSQLCQARLQHEVALQGLHQPVLQVRPGQTLQRRQSSSACDPNRTILEAPAQKENGQAQAGSASRRGGSRRRASCGSRGRHVHASSRQGTPCGRRPHLRLLALVLQLQQLGQGQLLLVLLLASPCLCNSSTGDA